MVRRSDEYVVGVVGDALYGVVGDALYISTFGLKGRLVCRLFLVLKNYSGQCYP